jgi:hypothetical protein
MEINRDRKPTALLWLGIVSTTIGGLTVLISLIVLWQPVSEENLWTLGAVPFLILGCCLFLTGVATLTVHLVLRLMGK